MNIGEVVYISSRLVIGALAAFFAIVLWSRIREPSWILIVLGTIALYVETVYSILELFGITAGMLSIGSVPLVTILLHNLPAGFMLAAFMVMVFQKSRKP
ncbi:MAG: hypothetical protein LBG76_01360 [Treponema sp.]|nr:hypothetical protein [Treponema sp.]